MKKKTVLAMGIFSLFGLLLIMFPSTKHTPTTLIRPLPCEAGCPTKYGQHAVWDFNKKECWSCPPGYVRSFELVTSRRACVLYNYGLYADARREGKLDCGEVIIAHSNKQTIK